MRTNANIKKINEKDILFWAKQGAWLNAEKIVWNYLEKTNFKICIHHPAYDVNEASNQSLYDDSLNNIIGIHSIPFTQNQKLKLCKFWLQNADDYVYD